MGQESSAIPGNDDLNEIGDSSPKLGCCNIMVHKKYRKRNPSTQVAQISPHSLIERQDSNFSESAFYSAAGIAMEVIPASLNTSSSMIECSDEASSDTIPAHLRRQYAFRARIPSFVDLTTHPEEAWWSDARSDRAEISRDMGDPKVMSRLLNVRHARRSQRDPADLMDFFDDYRPYMQGRSFIIFKMVLGDVVVVSIFEVMDKSSFHHLLVSRSVDDILDHRLKLITCPANLPINLPLKGAKAADTVGDYFGRGNCGFSFNQSHGGEYACIHIDVFSKWIIRKLLPTVAFTKGRVCDFIIVDYSEKTVICGLRVVCTSAAMKVLREHDISEE